jgi:putative DNA methylase
MSNYITPFSLKDTPALIERLLPVQKLSVEAYKEQEARQSKTLTALGSYWKGRKPLILNKACILGCLLPATDDSARDLEIFEKLMAMDDESFVARWRRRPRPKAILATLSIAHIADYFTVKPEGILPASAPVDWSKPEHATVKVAWRADCGELERRRLEAQMLPKASYRERVDQAQRPEEVLDTVHDHIWDAVNDHLGTSAHSFPELVEQLGIMRFGHRPRVADTFCGSGQIPFEAARLGCDVYASDLNPVACLLTWGAFNIVGGSKASREKLAKDQVKLVHHVQAEIDKLDVETDGKGWRAKVFLYCVEARCPQTGWMVPLLPTRVVSKGYRVVAELVPDPLTKRYTIQIRTSVSQAEIKAAETGTVGREGKYGEAYLIHQVDGVAYKTKISTLRGDYQKPDGTIGNRLRLWEKLDFIPQPDDLLQERLYCIQWMRPKKQGKGEEYEFRSVTEADLCRERIVQDYVAQHLADWQTRGWVPDMRIEVGGPPRYQGLDLIRARGWTRWHHLFNPRQLLVGALMNKHSAVNQCLVPPGIAKVHWDALTGAERFYLKLVDLEAKGLKTLDNYQNFAKAFKVRNFHALMASQKANQARLKSAVDFGKTEMSDSSELHQSVLRAVLYAMMELVKNMDSDEVMAHLRLNVPDYYANQTQRDRVVELADYLARQLETQRPDEASAARILRELVKQQRLG